MSSFIGQHSFTEQYQVGSLALNHKMAILFLVLHMDIFQLTCMPKEFCIPLPKADAKLSSLPVGLSIGWAELKPELTVFLVSSGL